MINSPQYSHYPSKIMFQSKGMCVQKVTTERKNESIHERMRGRVGCMILAVVEHSSLSCTLSLIESIYIYTHTYTEV